MTGSDGRSRSRPADDAGEADEPDGNDESMTAPTDDEGYDPGLLEHVADAVGDLWDDPPDEP